MLRWVVGLGRINIAIIKAASVYDQPAVQGKELEQSGSMWRFGRRLPGDAR